MKDLIYKYNGNIITKEKVNKILEELKVNKPMLYESCLTNLKEYGATVIARGERKTADYLSAAPQAVYDMSEIISNNEYDPIDGDSFQCAFALYKAGYRKIKR